MSDTNEVVRAWEAVAPHIEAQQPNNEWEYDGYQFVTYECVTGGITFESSSVALP